MRDSAVAVAVRLPRLACLVRVAGWIVPMLLSSFAGATCPSPRPTDAGGYFGYEYGSATVESFASPRLRVWYATTGSQAVDTTSTRPDGVPDRVAYVSQIGEDALTKYQSWGFHLPIVDSDASCQGGGDALLDIYLLTFSGADGLTATDACTEVGPALRCASFVLTESDFESKGYSSFEEGVRTVVPHELFHAVQNAYDADVDRFWAEGTAQWAAARIDPSLPDLERFLPDFFADPSRSIDISPGTVTSSFLYGAAVWPVFLTEHLDDHVVLEVLEEEGISGGPSLTATDTVLKSRSSSLSQIWPVFISWNAATGARSSDDAGNGTDGYSSAPEYPEVDLETLPSTGTVQETIAGFGTYYYRSPDEGAQISFTGNPDRLSARALPLHDGKVMPSMAVDLPISLEGPAVVFVTGITAKKSDAAYTLELSPAPIEIPDAGVPDASDASTDASTEAGRDAGTDADAGPDGGTDLTPSSTSPSTDASGGCSFTPSAGSMSSPLTMLVALAALRGRRSRRAFTVLLSALTLSALMLTGCTKPAPAPADEKKGDATKSAEQRLITVGGTITETVFALGAGDRVIAVDTSSIFPESAMKLPQVGYQRTLSAEGVIALHPTLVIASAEAGPAAALEQIRSVGIPVHVIPGTYTLQGAQEKIRAVAKLIGKEDALPPLLSEIDARSAELTQKLQKNTSQPKVLAVFARGPAGLVVSGTGTPADAMIRLAGAQNAAGAIEGSKPLSAESAVAAAPEVLLVTTHGLDGVGGLDGLLATPGISGTPAAKNRRVVTLDDLALLGFGPRTGQAAVELATKLHPDLVASP